MKQEQVRVRVRLRVRLVGVMVAGVVVLSGCGIYRGFGWGEAEVGTPIEQRPSIEQVERDYVAMLKQAQQVLTDQFGVGNWVQLRDPVSTTGCPENIDGGEVRRYNFGVAGPISDQDWDAALQAVAGIVAEQGFTGVEEYIDNPGDHNVRIHHPDGGYVDFGTMKATTLMVRTGCHLTEEALTERGSGQASR